ncbi:trypsin-like serine protease [Streptomyces lavendulocolor]|uniref:trypsin-like serine protease n=1 Tax=Streptomyces lavendulocolor TaxID=67316 RepID=UPI003C2CE4B4
MSGIRRRMASAAAVTATVVAAGALTAAGANAVVGDAAPADGHAYTAKLEIGENEAKRSCSGALVARQWILTAASCFATDPQQPGALAAGKPALDTTATVGRTDLSGTTGTLSQVVELVPAGGGRDLVLARLAKPTTGVAPVALATTAPVAGEQLRVAGFGRTATEWVPNKLHTATFAVDTVDTASLAISPAAAGSAICKGDTGGPLLRELDGRTELVGVAARSWQGGCLAETETRTSAVGTRSDDLKSWITSTVQAAPRTDFNCDGVRDVAAGDPQATVGGDAKAGLIRIVYGGGKGTAEITQDLDTVPGGSEPDDWYGEKLGVVDYNLDGCTDLVVGVPAEDLDTVTDAGTVQVLYGAPAGLAKGSPAALNLEQGKGTGAIAASASEAGDRMGHSIAAGTTASGEPYLLIGVPNEDLGTVANAGNVFYLRGTTNTSIHQDKPGVSGTPEKDDKFGISVAAGPDHLAIGSPGEAVETKTNSGGVEILQHKLNAEGIPTPVAGLNQDSDIISGSAETGDQFGASLAMVSTHQLNAANVSVLAVGSPGEDLGTATDAGRVVTLKINAAQVVSQAADISQDTTNMPGTAESGDNFGKAVSAVSTQPGAASNTAQNTLLAIGVPGEDIGTVADAGSITVVPLIGAPGDSATVVEAGNGMPGTPGASERAGTSIAAAGTHLYVGMPYGPASYGSAYAVPWVNILSGGPAAAVFTYQPGQGGLPAAGVAFGTAVR